MFIGLALVVYTITFALSVAMLAPQGMWIWQVALVISTGMIVHLMPMIKHKNDE